MPWWEVYCPNVNQYYAGDGTYVDDFTYAARYDSELQAQYVANSLNQQGICNGMNRAVKMYIQR